MIGWHGFARSEAVSEPIMGLVPYQCVARVLAGQITEVVAAGCYVRAQNGYAILRMFQPGMVEPAVGDWWVVSGLKQTIVPRAEFEAAYMPIEAPRDGV